MSDEIKDCRDCKSWKDCVGHDNYNYSEIRWCPYQCLWIIEHAEALRTGDWEITDDNIGSRNTPHDGNFIAAITVLSELEIRLDKTGADGQKLWKQVAEEGRELRHLSPRAKQALMYIKGWRRKRMSYRRWVREVYLKPKEKVELSGE